MAIAQDLGHLRRRRRQHGEQRRLAIGGEPVALEDAALVLVEDHPFARDDAPERRRDLGTARDHRGIGRRHAHGLSLPQFRGGASARPLFSVIPYVGPSAKWANKKPRSSGSAVRGAAVAATAQPWRALKRGLVLLMT